MARRFRNIRTSAEGLNIHAKNIASEAQKPVLDKLLQTGFQVLKVLEVSGRNAINLYYNDISGWLTYDGVFHRPVKGKKHVYVNTVTLERVWK